MTVLGDIQEYIEENINSIIPPDPLEYQPYETENANFKLESTTEAQNNVTTKSISNTDISSLDTPSPQQVSFFFLLFSVVFIYFYYFLI